MAFDAWAQPLERSLLDKLPEAFELLRKSSSATVLKKFDADPSFRVSIDEHVRLMDEAGVRRATLSAWFSPSKGWIIPNEVVEAYVRAYPDRFVGLCTVDIRDPVKACATIEEYVLRKGFGGVRIIPWLMEQPPTHRLFYPIFAKCAELGVPFCTQVGLTGPLFPSDPGRPTYIERVALDFPTLTIVCGHVGAPWTDEMLSVAWKFKNIYIDTSAYLPRRYPPQLLRFMRNNPHKVLFGSNFPHLSWKRCLEGVEALGLDPKTKRLFLHDNAARIFGNKLKKAKL